MSMGMDIITGTIKNDLNNNDVDFTMCAVGQRGAGKSEMALEFCRKVDPSFEKNPRIVFTIDEYMDAVDGMKKGQALIFDEAGVNMGAREWMHLQNKVFNYTKQLDRFNNLMVIYTVPDLGFIDLQLRKMLDAVVVCRKTGIDRAARVNATKFYYVNTSPLGGEIHYNPFIYHGPEGDIKIDPMYVPQAPPDLVAKYKKLSVAYKKKRIQELKDEARGDKADEADRYTLAVLNSQAGAGLKAIKALQEQMGWKYVSQVCGVGERQMRNWISYAGDDIKPPQKGQKVKNTAAFAPRNRGKAPA